MKRQKQPRTKKVATKKHKTSAGVKCFIQYIKQTSALDRLHSYSAAEEPPPLKTNSKSKSNKPIIAPNGELLTISDIDPSSSDTSDSEISSSSLFGFQ
jgi:hypothetical protein